MKDEYGTLLRGLFGIVLLGLPACVVDSPIAERTRTAEQEVSEDLDDWCSDICVRLVAPCTGTDCECAPTQAVPGAPVEECVCEATDSPDDCAEACHDWMSGFIGHGEACAEAGLASMACLDAANSCDDLDEDVEDCFHEPNEVSACNGGKVACDQDASGSAPVSIPSGSAGSGGAVPSTPFSTCDYMFSNCSDGAEYQVACGGAEVVTCECFRNGSYTGRFELAGTGCSLTSVQVNPGCGWNLSDF